MKAAIPSRAIALCGTEQPDVPGRVLTAGPLSVEFDNGQLRYLKVNGIEVLRAIGFLIRDKDWGTATPVISDLKVDQRADGFSVSFHAGIKIGNQELAYDARIEGTRQGNLGGHRTRIPLLVAERRCNIHLNSVCACARFGRDCDLKMAGTTG